MSDKICNACTDYGLDHCAHAEGKAPPGWICKYELYAKLTKAKIERSDKAVEVELRPANNFQKYQNMEGRKQYHISRNTSFTYFIRLYINGEEVGCVSNTYEDYDETIEELHKAGFTEGFWSSDVARKQKDYQKVKQEYEHVLQNIIRRKEDETTSIV